MQRAKRNVESMLVKKGFRVDERDHHYFIYHTQQGLKSIVKTKTSHSKKVKSISDPLINVMAKQCGLTRKQFTDFIDCPLNRNSYESILINNGLI